MSYASIAKTLDYFLKCELIILDTMPNAGMQGDVDVVAAPSVVAGKYDNAYSFDGSEYGAESSTILAEVADFTLGGWFQSDDESDEPLIALASTFDTTLGDSLSFQPFARWGGGSGKGVRFFFESATPAIEFDVSDDEAVADGGWHYHVIRKTDTLLEYFFDLLDAPAATATVAATTNAGHDTIQIGARSGANDAYIGLMDDVFLHSAALNNGQLATLKAGPVATTGGLELMLP